MSQLFEEKIEIGVVVDLVMRVKDKNLNYFGNYIGDFDMEYLIDMLLKGKSLILPLMHYFEGDNCCIGGFDLYFDLGRNYFEKLQYFGNLYLYLNLDCL